MKKLKYLYQTAVSSFWFVPSLIVFIAILVAIGMIYFDNHVKFNSEGVLSMIFTGSPDSARSVLSTIAGAMIGVAGTVFSITLVALTLASSQFGPRLLSNFMHVRINQVVLGTYIATYVYALIILNTVRSNEATSFVPSYSVLLAIFAAVANIGLLIVFIHHVAVSIQADNVVADISRNLSGTIENVLKDLRQYDLTAEIDVDEEINKFSSSESLKVNQTGYIRFIDFDRLISNAREEDTLYKIDKRPGEYVVAGQEIGIFCSNKTESKERFNEMVLIGKNRQTNQDLEFSILQMVEIAVRALSPGINDPFTALTCVDNLSSTLSLLTYYKFPSEKKTDDEGQLRVYANSLNFAGVLNAAFNQIRQNASQSPSVLIRILEGLKTIKDFAETEEQIIEVKKHALMVKKLAENSFDEPNDLNDLLSRYQRLMADD